MLFTSRFPRVFATLLLAAWAGVGLAQPAQKPPFEDDILKFEASDATNPPKPGGVVFVGSSSIRMWESLATDFPGVHTINRGFGGSHIEDSVRNVHRIVTPYKPTMIVFFAGTNDIASGKTPERVATDYKAFVAAVRSKLPKAKIAFISISPAPSRWAKVDDVRKANALVREFSASQPNLLYVNVFDSMLDAKGGPRPELFLQDQLHMNRSGYEIWVKAVAPLLPKPAKE